VDWGVEATSVSVDSVGSGGLMSGGRSWSCLWWKTVWGAVRALSSRRETEEDRSFLTL
jgi:hypothetical protein